MFKTKSLKGGGSLPISVDSRGGSIAGPAYADVNATENYLNRDSIMDLNDPAYNAYLSKRANKQSWIPKKVNLRSQ